MRGALLDEGGDPLSGVVGGERGAEALLLSLDPLVKVAGARDALDLLDRDRRLPAAASIDVNALMSAPAQNSIGLAEANTSERTLSDALTSSHIFTSACTTSGEIEFAGGRSSHAIAIRSRSSSFTGLSSYPGPGRGYGKKPWPDLTPSLPCATSRRRISGGSKASPHSCAARSSLESTSSSPSWSARASGGG